MSRMLPIKKQVSLHWLGRTVSLDVAQDLFSSHQVDRGSKMLLSSLEPLDLPGQGSAVDFGCGYGVLGLAWQVTHPAWSMCYVDRDALAVAFAEHNAAGMNGEIAGRASFLHDVTPPAPPEQGFDLVLWNVPGKAGEQVLQSLTTIILDGLGKDGLLALVVVNPLAPALRQIADRPDVSCDLDETGRNHTVLHLRKLGSALSHRDAFAHGVFDRPVDRFGVGDRRWQLRPVIGLPDYDSLSFATALAGEAMPTLERPARWLVYEPGVGHLAVLAGLLWPGSEGVVASRDALALRATGRTLEELNGASGVVLRAVLGVHVLEPSDGTFDLAVVAVPEQIQVDEVATWLGRLGLLMASGGSVLLHGSATEIGRFARAMRSASGWKVGARTRQRGASALVAQFSAVQA